MLKRVSPVLLSLLVVAATGCQMLRPDKKTPDAALQTFHARLNESCPEKHLENLPASEINRLAKAHYIAADTQAQQLIDLDAGTMCKSNDQRPACYNTGFIQALDQTKGLDEFVKTVCGLPVTCTGPNQCGTETPATKAETASAPASEGQAASK